MRSILILSIIFVILLAGCKDKEVSYGAPIPENAVVIPLSKVIDSPDSYHEKTVLLEGYVTAQCGNRCEFTYTENKSSVKIFMGELKAPIIKFGTAVRVMVEVYKGEKKTVFSAKGFTLKQKGGK